MVRVRAYLDVVTFASVLALGVSGCSATPATYTFPTCALPNGIQASLVYPQPNSTKNSTNITQVIIATSAALPSTWAVVLVYPPNSTNGGAIQPAQPPFPTPNQTPSFSNPVYYSSAFSGQGAVPANQSITVTLKDTSSNCAPNATLGVFGT